MGNLAGRPIPGPRRPPLPRPDALGSLVLPFILSELSIATSAGDFETIQPDLMRLNPLELTGLAESVNHLGTFHGICQVTDTLYITQLWPYGC